MPLGSTGRYKLDWTWRDVFWIAILLAVIALGAYCQTQRP